MEGHRGRKHPLKVLSALDNGPAAKKTRNIDGASVSQWRQGSSRDSDQRQESRQRVIRTGKRKKMPDSQRLEENDENQFHDLEESVKRLRIRPFVFSITSFIEQNVDSVSFNFGDTGPEPEPELVVVLPFPFNSSSAPASAQHDAS